jgi:hypothetical protein
MVTFQITNSTLQVPPVRPGGKGGGWAVAGRASVSPDTPALATGQNRYSSRGRSPHVPRFAGPARPGPGCALLGSVGQGQPLTALRSCGRCRAACGKGGVARPVSACDRGQVPQPVLRTARLLLVPLADRHLDLEIQLDSDPEVLRYLGGRARSAAEVAESHARRMALTGGVDGLGFWMAFGSGGGARGSTTPGHDGRSNDADSARGPKSARGPGCQQADTGRVSSLTDTCADARHG